MNALLRSSFAALVLLSSFGVVAAQEEKQESVPAQPIAEFLQEGEKAMVIDLAPAGFPDLLGAKLHGIKGSAKITSVKKAVDAVAGTEETLVEGTYGYPTAAGPINAKFAGKIEEDSLSVKFSEKGLMAQNGFGKFTPERDEKTGKVLALRGWWKVNDFDPELRWDIVPKPEKKDVEKKD